MIYHFRRSHSIRAIAHKSNRLPISRGIVVSVDGIMSELIENKIKIHFSLVHPKNLSKKYAKQSNFLAAKQELPEFETKSVELLRGKLLPAARPKKC